MSEELAEEYAESVASGIRKDTANGHPFGPDEGDSAYDYLENAVLDITYMVSRDGHYVGAEILIAYGGPSAWINTREYELVVSWGTGSKARRWLPEAFIDGLDEALQELWSTR